MTLTVGSLFTGIGGIDLGLERAGMRVIWQAEVDPYACRVLAKHWPDIPNLGDVTTVDWSQVERPDVLCGGYPCQPFSVAGARAGTSDPRHLWPHMWRAISVLRPRYCLLENVAGHLTLGFGDVLADLASGGYRVEWDCIPAQAVGAPHRRDRLFAVAYPSGVVGDGGKQRTDTSTRPLQRQVGRSGRDDGATDVADADCGQRRRVDAAPGDGGTVPSEGERGVVRGGRRRSDVADPDCGVSPERGQRASVTPAGVGGDVERGRSGRDVERQERVGRTGESASSVADARRKPAQVPATRQQPAEQEPQRTGGRPAQPGMGRAPDGLPRRLDPCRLTDTAAWLDGTWEDGIARVASGVPDRLARLKALGNAVVPQVAEHVGRRIVAHAETVPA